LAPSEVIDQGMLVGKAGVKCFCHGRIVAAPRTGV